MKKTTNMKCYFRVNNQALFLSNPNQIMINILSSITNLECWSYEALRDFYLGITNMISEYCNLKVNDLNKGESKRSYTGFITKQNKSLQWMPRTQEGMVKRIYETILSGEGMGLNRGHGFLNLKGNSDLQRASKDHTIGEKEEQ